MTDTVARVEARRSDLPYEVAMGLFAVELARSLRLLRSLDADQWTSRTDCPDWDVRELYLHVLGAVESGASVRELGRQFVVARRRQRTGGGPLEAALSATQVADRAAVRPTELVARLEAAAPRCVRSRQRIPRLLRERLTFAVDGPVIERWSLGYLLGTIYLRDAWMHRVDAVRATGVELELTPEHDGVIVADVVHEWGRRHGRPHDLVLTGPAGGTWTRGSSETGERLEVDAVEFCRSVSGRSVAGGLAATLVPF